MTEDPQADGPQMPEPAKPVTVRVERGVRLYLQR